jgi:hypothetical protein
MIAMKSCTRVGHEVLTAQHWQVFNHRHVTLICHILGLNGVTLSRGICFPAADDSDCLSQIRFRMARLLAVTKCDQ